MRTFFRNKFSDSAAGADLVVIQGREQADNHGNRGVTKSKDKASSGLYELGKHPERLRRLQGPCGPGPSTPGYLDHHPTPRENEPTEASRKTSLPPPFIKICYILKIKPQKHQSGFYQVQAHRGLGGAEVVLRALPSVYST